MNKLNSWYELIGQEEDCFKAESAGAKVEQIFKGGTKKLHDHHIEIALRSTPFDGGNAYTTLHYSVEFWLYVKLRMFRFDTFKFDSDCNREILSDKKQKLISHNNCNKRKTAVMYLKNIIK